MCGASSNCMILIGLLTALPRITHLTSHARSDGLWDREEIEAIYGVHHLYSQKKSKVVVI
jgi:hypothetical protein